MDEDLEAVGWACACVEAQSDLKLYAQMVNPEWEFLPHLEEVVNGLEQITSGEINRLIINIPPQHGKSLIISKIFPGYWLGHNPGKNVILASYSEDPATENSRDLVDYMGTEEHRHIFPKTLYRRGGPTNFQLYNRSKIYASGFRGGITGKGAHLIIVDDPFKNWTEAQSEKTQNHVWKEYWASVRSRLRTGGTIVIVHTRWHVNDLTGRLLAMAGSDNWKHVILPLKYRSGKLLSPDLFTQEDVKELENLPADMWDSIYQQNPEKVQQKKQFNFIRRLEPVPGYRIAWLDPAFTKGSSKKNQSQIAMVVVTLSDHLGKTIHGKYIPGVQVVYGALRDGHLYDEVDRMAKLCEQYFVDELIIESNQAQSTFIPIFKERGIKTRGHHTSLNKITKIKSRLGLVWSNVYFANAVEEDFINQIKLWSVDSEKMDAPDSLASLVDYLFWHKAKVTPGFI